MKKALFFLFVFVAWTILVSFLTVATVYWPQSENMLTRKENGMTKHGTFACAINCMDGRAQEAITAYLRDNYGVDHVDTVTEPGPNKILADNTDTAVVANIEKRVGISVSKHHSSVIAVVAHPECAGNPVEKDQQIEDLRSAYATVESFGFSAEIILLWVEDDWKTVEKIDAPVLETAQ